MRTPPYPRAGYLLGFALGGFFDGILLHQVLQWHHLLQGVEGAVFRQVRTQILADGLFHLLMYAIALGGLWSLWRARNATALSGRKLLADALVAFGAWHVIDGVLSHWVLGIHRIRMDSPDPLLWDLLWFVVFGILPFIAGMALRRRASSADGGGSRRAVAVSIATAVITAAPLAALPPADSRQVAVLVLPSELNRLLDGISEMKGGILWAHPGGTLWVLTLDSAESASRLYAHGALLVTRSPAALGCLAFARY